MSLRRATPEDAAELVRLRGLMYESFRDAEEPGVQWRDRAEEVLSRRLRDDDDFVAFVVDGPDGTLVASGVGWISEHLPNPWNLSGRRGHIASMSTVTEHRRRGHGRRIMAALVDWFDQRDISRVDLVATSMGEPLYRSFGFDVHPDAVALVRRSESL